jgi:2,4-dienoyl-CoA reductase-like NADH-dependent reductase (Old Yellow Enzyme family)
MLKNRIIVAPMCTFSCEPDATSPAVGALTPFHTAHLGHLATKGVGMVMIEATAVLPSGRISPQDSGLWQDGPDSEQVRGLRNLVEFVHSQGCAVGLQLSHAGRKGSTVAPWLVPKEDTNGHNNGQGQTQKQRRTRGSLKASTASNGWPDEVVAPTGGEEMKWAPGDDAFCTPQELSISQIQEIVAAFARSARLAVSAGVDVIEVHGAHGYLIHQFLSPVTNRRTDCYGGSFENRTRLLREVLTAIRAAIPAGTPLFLRISATEWLETAPVSLDTGSWDVELSVRLAMLLPGLGVDLLDVSSGGNHKDQQIQPHSKYQVSLAGKIRRAVRAAGLDLLVGAVGLIREAEAARDIVQVADIASDGDRGEDGDKEREDFPEADVVLIARQFLREPNWVFAAAKTLDVPVSLPCQFGRGLL